MTRLGRPVTKGCSYYRHLTTMRNHRKVKAIRNKFGQVLGYAFWSMMLEYLTEQDGNVLEYSDMEMELLSAELGVSVTEIRSMVDYCVHIEILFLKDGFINSDSLDELLESVYEKREKAKTISATQKRRKDGTFGNKSEDTVIVSTESPNDTVIVSITKPQSRVEKSREENTNNVRVFEKFRFLYGGVKRGGETEFKNFKKKHSDWEEVLPKLKPILERQINHRKRLTSQNEFVPKWKNLQTWINQRCWEDEMGELPQGKNDKGETKHTEYVVTGADFYGHDTH